MATHLNGQPWKQQYSFNDSAPSTITVWGNGTSMPDPPFYYSSNCSVAVIKGYVYSFSPEGEVYRATIASGGTIGTFTSYSTLSYWVGYKPAVFITSTRVYVIACYDSPYQGATFYAPINSDGSLGTWNYGGTSLSSVLSARGRTIYYYPPVAITKDRVYLFGGAGVVNNVYGDIFTAPIDSSGVVGTWTYDRQLAVAVARGTPVVTLDRVYLLGGLTIVSGVSTATATVQYATFDSSGVLGNWTTATSMPYVTIGTPAVVSSDRVFLLGTADYSEGYGRTTYAPIDSSGVIGTWSDGDVVDNEFYNDVIVTSSQIILLNGGTTGGDGGAVESATYSGGFNDYTAYTGEPPIIGGGTFNILSSSFSGYSGGYGSTSIPSSSVSAFGGNSGYVETAMSIQAEGAGGSYGAITLPLAEVYSLGGELVIGDGSYLIPHPICVSFGTNPNIGGGSLQLPKTVMSADAGASGEIDCFALSMAAAGDSENIGTGAYDMPRSLFAGAGSTINTGDGSYTIPLATFSGVAVNGTVGSGTYQIPSFRYSGIGAVSGPNVGSFTIQPISVRGYQKRTVSDTALDYDRDGCTFTLGTLTDAVLSETILKHSRTVCQP